jgi:general stress protein 26
MIKHLSDQEAIKKMQEIANRQVCFLGTYPQPYQQEARPMTTLEVDEEGNFLFFVKNDQDSIQHIRQHKEVDLLYNNGSSYLAVHGDARTYRDQKKIDKYYNPIADVWFDGKNDPTLMILEVKPTDAHYWTTADGKIVTLYKMAKATLAGEEVNIGVKGDLHI